MLFVFLWCFAWLMRHGWYGTRRALCSTMPTASPSAMLSENARCPAGRRAGAGSEQRAAHRSRSRSSSAVMVSAIQRLRTRRAAAAHALGRAAAAALGTHRIRGR